MSQATSIDLKTGLARSLNPAKNKAINPKKTYLYRNGSPLWMTQTFFAAPVHLAVPQLLPPAVLLVPLAVRLVLPVVRLVLPVVRLVLSVLRLVPGLGGPNPSKTHGKRMEKVKSMPGSKQMAVGYKKLNTFVSKRYLLLTTRESRGVYFCCLHPTVVNVGNTSTPAYPNYSHSRLESGNSISFKENQQQRRRRPRPWWRQQQQQQQSE